MKLITVLFSLLPILSHGAMIVQDDAASESTTTKAEKPYEIVVTGEVTRSRLRTLITQVEDDFFARFNELNIDDDFDIQCYEYTPTMSHIKKRQCEPEFMIRARAENASQATFLLGQTGRDTINSSQNSANVLDPKAMRHDVEGSYRVLQEKLEQLSREDTEFRQIGNVLAELKNRLENYGEE